MTKPSTSRLGPHFFVFDAKYYGAIIRQKTESCSRRILSIEDIHEGLASNLWTKKERIDAVEAVHSALSAVSMGNCHSAVAGIGGTARAATKVAILLDLKKAHGVGGTLLDVGCSFGHFMLAALQMGYKGACGCDLPENHVQCAVLTKAKAWLGISPDDLCEWIGSDVTNLVLPERLSRRITGVYSFWNGLSRAARWNFVGSWSTSDQWLFIGLKDGRNQSQASQHTVCVIDPHSQKV